VIIRKALLKDSEIVAACLLLAMEDIVYKFIGERDFEKATESMRYFVEQENNQYSYQNCWVAEDENGVVAAVNLYDGASLAALRNPVMEYIQSRYSTNLSPEDETSAGEYYIDSLGVEPAQQGKGIGSQLLEFLINEYVHRRKQTLGLLVDEANTAAKKIYLKQGFKNVGTKVLLGKRLEHLQIKG
jgi:ribosomal protein S18 acetylase RimI-like enzyme